MRTAAHESQLSLMPAFGVVNHPESDRYNQAKDRWAAAFGAYVTLLRYTPQTTSISQSNEQKAALQAALSHPDTAKALYAIDVGESDLNAKIRRYISGAQMVLLEQQQKAERQRLASKGPTLAEQEQSRKAADEARQVAKLAQLELREKLLAYEAEFDTVALAQSSRWAKMARQVPDVRVVVTPKNVWNSRLPIGADGRPLYDPMEIPDPSKPDGWWKTSYLLTFEPVQ